MRYRKLNDLKRSSITRIHVGKNQLAMGDDEYRFMLRSITGKNSCKDMTLGELIGCSA